MKADGSLKSLLQGVSQQPTRDRLPGQCTEQINMSSDPVQGLCRRPGDDLVARLSNVTALHWFDMITQDGEKFIGKVVAGGVEMYNLNGVSYPVVNNSSASYWGAVGSNFRTVTIKDRTFIANTNVTVRTRDAQKAFYNQGPSGGSWTPVSIIQFLGGMYGRTYRVYLNGAEVAAYRTPDGSKAEHSQYVGAEYLCRVIRWLLENPSADPLPSWIYVGENAAAVTRTNTMNTSNGWAYQRAGDILRVRRTTQTAFDLTVSDDAGLTTMKSLVDSVPDIADLPRFAPNGFVVRIAQESDPAEDLWMEFRVDSGGALGSGFGQSGAWYETVSPFVRLGFNKATMPKIMTFDGTTFTITENEWEDRAIGTAVTNPNPSFVDTKIRDLGMFQGRLVVLAGNSLCASRVNNHLNFWMGSASAIKDTDPLDLSSQSAYADVLKWVIPHNKDLVIFSERGQFVMFGRTSATPSNAALVLTTSFEADLAARPVAAGRNVFFATQFGAYTGLREFYTEGGSDINDTRPVTQHVKKYLKGGVKHLSSTSTYDKLFVHTDNDAKEVYLYEFIWADQEKVQSSWSKWKFNADVVYSLFDFEQVYFIRRRPSGYYFLSRMYLDAPEEPAAGYHIHLSERWDVFGVNKQFILPLWFLSQEALIIVQGAGCPNPGMPATILSVESTGVPGNEEWLVTLKENMGGGDIVGGSRFQSEYWPTMPRVRDQSNDVIGNARLMVNKFLIQTEDSVHLVGQKMAKWGNGPEVSFHGYQINGPDTYIGDPPIGDHRYNMPFKERADRGELRLFTDRHWPLNISEIEYEGTVNKRGRRITTGDR